MAREKAKPSYDLVRSTHIEQRSHSNNLGKTTETTTQSPPPLSRRAFARLEPNGACAGDSAWLLAERTRLHVGLSYTDSRVREDVPVRAEIMAVLCLCSLSRETAVFFVLCVANLDRSKCSKG